MHVVGKAGGVESGEQMESFSKTSITLSLRKTTTHPIKATENIKF